MPRLLLLLALFCLAWAASPAPQPQCVHYLTCGTCLEDIACGWCSHGVNQRCLNGTSAGPIEGSCTDWYWNQCPVTPTTPPPTTRPSGCPPARRPVLGGYAYAGYCWYFSLPNSTCDDTCSSLAGMNLASEAQNAFVGSSVPLSSDVTTVIYQKYGNPGAWAGPTTLAGSCNTLGWAWSISTMAYFGKAAGTTECGTFPGEEGNPTVSPICPCFTHS